MAQGLSFAIKTKLLSTKHRIRYTAILKKMELSSWKKRYAQKRIQSIGQETSFANRKAFKHKPSHLGIKR